MAMVHENLYGSSSFTNLNFKKYMKKLVFDIISSHEEESENIQTELDIEDIEMNMETAIPCGLIINELVTNSIKYAFPEQNGTIKIELKSLTDEIELIIADNDRGFPDDIDFKNTESLGLQLVDSFVKQLDGKLELDNIHGAEFKIRFKESDYNERM